MIYNKFNLYIKNKFFPVEKTGETIIFSVDENNLNEFCEGENISYEELKNSISEIINNKYFLVESVEYCFGLCAIQVFIASQMQNENQFSRRQYNPRLYFFLNINIGALQSLYNKSQDIIWDNLKSFCEEHSFHVNIPSPTTGKGRFVQYPFSQVLLNKADLKETSALFEKAGIKNSEYISYKDFFRIIKTADTKNCMNSHYYRIKERLVKDYCTGQLYKQIYNYFIYDWDGSYPQKKEHEKNIKKYSANDENIHLFLNKTHEYIIVSDNNYEKIADVYLCNENVFEKIKQYHKVYNEDFLIFKIESNDDPEYMRFFETEEKYIIICNNKSEANKYIFSLCGIEYSKQYDNYNLYFTETIKTKSNHFFWQTFFSLNSRNYKIEGGIKLSYKTWMYKCGPKIIFNEVTDIWIDGKKFVDKEIDCRDYSIGIHKIVINSDLSIEKFYIEVPDNKLNVDCSGWNIDVRLKKWMPANTDFQNTGLIYNFPQEIGTSTVRDWTSLLTKGNKNIKYTSIVLNAIKRSYYGI